MNHLDTILEHRSLIGANNYGWCFEYDGFDAHDVDYNDDHEDSEYQANHIQVARWLQRWRGLFGPFPVFPPGTRSPTYHCTQAPANQRNISTD